jgi:hypothetical protein
MLYFDFFFERKTMVKNRIATVDEKENRWFSVGISSWANRVILIDWLQGMETQRSDHSAKPGSPSLARSEKLEILWFSLIWNFSKKKKLKSYKKNDLQIFFFVSRRDELRIASKFSLKVSHDFECFSFEISVARLRTNDRSVYLFIFYFFGKFWLKVWNIFLDLFEL